MTVSRNCALFQELPVQAWWQDDSPLRTLHSLNPARLKFISDIVSGSATRIKTILDAGCGGGILSMGLARAGHHVTGVDESGNAITAATRQAKLEQLQSYTSFKQADIYNFCQDNHESFDMITCMELVEHAANPDKVVSILAAQLKPDGHIVLSTLNRTMTSYLLNIVAAEYILRLLPAGTHDWQCFITPAEIVVMLQDAGCEIVTINGIRVLPGLWRSTLVQKPGHHYILHARKLP